MQAMVTSIGLTYRVREWWGKHWHLTVIQHSGDVLRVGGYLEASSREVVLSMKALFWTVLVTVKA